MILNFDRGYGQSAEQMVQSLMESTQMAFDTLERKLGLSEGSLIDDDGNVIADKIEANDLAVKGKLALGTALSIANGGTGATTVAGARNALGLGNTSGAVPVANGGTGATTAAAARTNLDLSGAFVIEQKSKSNVSVSASNVAEVSIDASKTGYKCIGIVGITINNASGQTGSANVVTRSFNVGTDNSCYITVRNVSTTARTIDVTAHCLYVKE